MGFAIVLASVVSHDGLLEVSRSGFYRWDKMTASERDLEDAKLRPRIAAWYAASGETYGSPRIQADLVAEGLAVGNLRVARLMREMGLYALAERRFRKTTDSSHGLGFAADLVQRDFNPSEPNMVWASDITYIWTDGGWAYLAAVLDLFSRRVVGWAIAQHMIQRFVPSCRRGFCIPAAHAPREFKRRSPGRTRT